VSYDVQAVRKDVVGLERRFPRIDGSEAPLINFDNSAATPVLKPVLAAVNEFLEVYANVHRGQSWKSVISTHAYDEAHERVARFVGADPRTNTVILAKNTTSAINRIARRFPFRAGDRVLVTLMEHHSNDLPWRAQAAVEHVDLDPDGALDVNDLERRLRRLGGRARVVAISGGSNVTGVLNPIHRIARLAHQYGAKIVVDAAQLAPHRAIDMKPDDDPEHLDYVVFTSNKMYAPFGVGVLVGDKEPFAAGPPDEPGGGTIKLVTSDIVEWADLPDREEGGTPNVVGAVALARAIRYLEGLGWDAIAAHEQALTARLLARLKEIPGCEIYGPPEGGRRLGVVALNLMQLPHAILSAALNYEHGIATRNGCFCAHPYVKYLLRCAPEIDMTSQAAILAGDRANMPGAVRVSFGIYNTEAEVDALVDALAKLATDGPRARYTQAQSGQVLPENLRFDPAAYFTI
jgi:selenocysteine lyase/cysteine desulfurase